MSCVHHWLLELPRHGVVMGDCRYCGRRYRRKELTYADNWNLTVVQERRWNDVPAPLNDW